MSGPLSRLSSRPAVPQDAQGCESLFSALRAESSSTYAPRDDAMIGSPCLNCGMTLGFHHDDGTCTTSFSLRVCGSTVTYSSDERGWRRLDWLRGVLTGGTR